MTFQGGKTSLGLDLNYRLSTRKRWHISRGVQGVRNGLGAITIVAN